MPVQPGSGDVRDASSASTEEDLGGEKVLGRGFASKGEVSNPGAAVWEPHVGLKGTATQERVRGFWGCSLGAGEGHRPGLGLDLLGRGRKLSVTWGEACVPWEVKYGRGFLNTQSSVPLALDMCQSV